jgi:predicted homoserine dehydrogenase-like protein
MTLHRLLQARAAAGRPVGVALIGAGKFGTMFLAQARLTAGLHVVAVADLAPARARARLAEAGWPAAQFAAASLDDAHATGATCVTDDAGAALAHPGVEVVVEATGDPLSGVRFCRAAIAAGKHVVMVNVEADALAGPLLAREAAAAGVVYSLAWGDQPALICDHVDWARSCGLEVVAAGKGTRYHPSYHASTPDTVWGILDQYLQIADRAAINPKMFNSFLDGTKSAIEMTAVCNATGLHAQEDGLGFPPASRFELAEICKPRAAGGTLARAGVTEVVSSIRRDHAPVPHDLALGTFVVFTAESDYARRCFGEYRMLPDSSLRYAALYRPTHLIGLELGVSIASAALRREPTGAPICFNADVVAIAKRDLKAGEIVDGEGGFCVWGRQMPAARSCAAGLLPLGLAHGVRLRRAIAAGQALSRDDVDLDPADDAVRARREMEAAFLPPPGDAR